MRLERVEYKMGHVDILRRPEEIKWLFLSEDGDKEVKSMWKEANGDSGGRIDRRYWRPAETKIEIHRILQRGENIYR